MPLTVNFVLPSVAQNALLRRFYELPRLIYLPFEWGKIDQIRWLTLAHSGKQVMLPKGSQLT